MSGAHELRVSSNFGGAITGATPSPATWKPQGIHYVRSPARLWGEFGALFAGLQLPPAFWLRCAYYSPSLPLCSGTG